MELLTLILSLTAIFMAAAGIYLVLRYRETTDSEMANLALHVAEQKKEFDEREEQERKSAQAWDEGINNMMSYTLKGYGLNTDFLSKEESRDG